MKNYIKQVARNLHKTEYSHLKLSQCLDKAVLLLGLAQSWQQLLQKPEAVRPILLMDVFLHPENLWYRYQLDGTWRISSQNEEYVEGDFFTTDHNVFIKMHKQFEVEGINLNGNNRSFYLDRLVSKPMEPATKIYSTVIYCVPQTPPSFETMRSVFANTIDEGTNVLILDIYGQYFIKNIDNISKYELSSIVCMSELGLVGKKASEDEEYMLNEYRDTLSAWLTTMTSGRTGYYCDISSTETIEDLLRNCAFYANLKTRMF